jgi:hypothetical protein
MILVLVQLAALSFIGLYLCRWMISRRRRNAQSWQSLITHLRPDWSGRDLSEHFLWKEGLNATPEETWKHIQGARGLCAMYHNARVMLEMADFAARHCESVDPMLLETLRSDAMQIRVSVLMALFQYAFSQASEGVRVNAFRAASMYTGMAARMTQLIQDNAAMSLPDFVAAM